MLLNAVSVVVVHAALTVLLASVVQTVQGAVPAAVARVGLRCVAAGQCRHNHGRRSGKGRCRKYGAILTKWY